MKSILDVLKEVTDALSELKIDYMVVGSVGSMVYGRARSTLDIGLVVQIKAFSIQGFSERFKAPDYYCPPTEVLLDEISRQGLFNLVHIDSGIKIDVILVKNTDFYQSDFSRRREIEFLPGFVFYVASPEDIIIKKLDYYREGGSEKHLEDIRAMLAVTPTDQNYLQNWICQLSLESAWAKI
jgi:hypothetical protein